MNTLNINEREIDKKALVLSLIFWGLAIAWMIFIFYMSSESGAESSKRSMKIVEYIESLGIFPFMTESIIRKAAHVTEYAILTILSFNSVKYTNLISIQTSYSQNPVKIIKSDNEMYIVISFWISAVYSSIDEYHQLFVSGRNGSIYDFLIDMTGCVFVLIIFRLIFTFNLRRHGLDEPRYD